MDNEVTTAVEVVAGNQGLALSPEMRQNVAVFEQDALQRAWRMDHYTEMDEQSLQRCAAQLTRQRLESYIERAYLVWLLFQKLPDRDKAAINFNDAVDAVRATLATMTTDTNEELPSRHVRELNYEIAQLVQLWEIFEEAKRRGMMEKPSDALTLFPHIKNKTYLSHVIIYCCPHGRMDKKTTEVRLAVLYKANLSLEKVSQGSEFTDEDLPESAVASAESFRSFLRRTYMGHHGRKGLPIRAGWLLAQARRVARLQLAYNEHDVDKFKAALRELVEDASKVLAEIESRGAAGLPE